MRVPPTLEEERNWGAGEPVVGLDEVGRGALAGPLVVGAVVVNPAGDPPVGLADSKRLSARQRQLLVPAIEEWALDWGLGWVSAQEIDRWGVRAALAAAAGRALGQLRRVPSRALVDGSFNLLDPGNAPLGEVPPAEDLRYAALPARAVVKGDDRCASMAAASVLAKVARDAHMASLAKNDGRWGWEANKGYGAPAHLAALAAFGPCDQHRRSWRLVRD